MKSSSTCSPRLEILEDRFTPTLFTVNTVADTTAPDGKLSLREAIQLANTGPTNVVDIVRFSPVVFGKTIQLEQGNLLITQCVRIEGPGLGRLTIDGNNSTDLFRLEGSQTSVKAVLSGLTMTRGETGQSGGAVHTSFQQDDGLVISNCLFTKNNASGSGGALYSRGGHVTLQNSIFRNNSAGVDGGAVWSGLAINEVPNSLTGTPQDESLGVLGCVFSNNVANEVGGGMVIDRLAAFWIGRSMFLGNTTTNEGGGGLWVANAAQGTIANSTFAGNRTSIAGNENTAYGGGIGIDKGDVEIINTTITNNTSRGGGGIWLGEGDLTVRNVTIVGNLGFFGGGGLAVGIGNVKIMNSIIAGNWVGDMTYGDLAGPPEGRMDTLYSLIHVAAGSINGDIIGCIFAKLPLVGPLRFNGGPTLTLALRPGSPALNAGNNALIGLRVDQRGLPRIGAGRVDMGAFEVQPVSVKKLAQRLRWHG